MPGFKLTQTEIKAEPADVGEVEVKQLEPDRRLDLQEYEFGRIADPGGEGYDAKKRKYGALSTSDPDYQAADRKGARFQINPLLKDPLSIADEERRMIEEKVRARLKAVQDEAREKAVREGYEAGRRQGYEEAFAEFQKESTDKLREIESFIGTCENAKRELLQANERALIEIIYRIGRLILLRELEADREYLLRLASELVERVGTRENIRIRVSAKDLQNIDMLKEGLAEQIGGLTNLHVEVSDKIESGGCIVESEWNAIDAAIDTQLQQVHAALTGEKEAGEKA